MTLTLPEWVQPFLGARPTELPDVEQRMRLVLDMGTEHVERGTGGPFAAAVFDADTHQLIAVGVNLVVPASTPIAHAEMVAFTFAGQRLGNFDLSAGGPTELVTSTEPCAMCLGAVHWSGIERLVISARDEDARRYGFDEGHKPDGWATSFAEQGITVQRDVLREGGVEVLRNYAEGGGHIYNAGSGNQADEGAADDA
ncbi:MAG: nucleoside deaminase [Actinomycetota bacterium]|nr:nucleoside deaminase [Actinomycetota bacterium]